MSFSFSEESIFFIKNWETIEKFLNSLENFKSEFPKFLNSVRELLQEKDWWSEEIIFNKESNEQIYISKKDWCINNQYCIWIGVQSFNPKSLLGTAKPAECYMWGQQSI